MKKCVISIFVMVLLAAGLFAQNMSPLQMADSIYNSHQYEASIQYYEKADQMDPGNYEINWKFSRSLVDAGEMNPDKNTQKAYYDRAVQLAEKAVSIDSSGWEGHLFAAVSYGRKALAAGAKERVKLSKQVRAEAEKAIELNPESDIAYHVLARWHRKITSLSWIERKFANMFLGGIPKGASKEKAVELFQKAIELKPDYINHYLELGITLKEMDRKAEAKKALEKAVNLKAGSPRDENYQKEAAKLLEKMKD